MNGEWLLCWWVEWEARGQVEARKMQRAGDGCRCRSSGSDEAAIKFAVLMCADTIHGIEGSAAVDHQDRLAVRPGEACRTVGEFRRWEESFVQHQLRLRRGGCRRQLCGKGGIELCGEHLAESIRLLLEWKRCNDRFEVAHDNGASRFGFC